MDRQAIIGIFLIIIITLLMPYVFRYIYDEPPAPIPITDAPRDSMGGGGIADTELREPEPPPSVAPAEKETASTASDTVVPSGIIPDSLEKKITISSGILTATLSNAQGGRMTSWIMEKYNHYSGRKVDLMSGNEMLGIEPNGLNLEFGNVAGKNIRIRDFTFSTDFPDDHQIHLSEENPSATIDFYLPVGNGRLVKSYTFFHNRYSAQVVVRFENLTDYIGTRWYSIGWDNGLAATEENIQEDYSYARACAYLGGELEALDASEGETETVKKSGIVEWTAIRTKYFVSAIIPNQQRDLSVSLLGYGFDRDDAFVKVYSTALGVELDNLSNAYADTFTVYLGPLDYSILSDYEADLETLVMNKDWYESLFRPISLLILPAFKFLHGFIPNYGLVIIIFSILIKLLLHPLTKKSYQSMSQMQSVQPELTRIREQYKNDAQRLNKEMMKLYKENNINPLGGCIPMFLQMPLLFALFIVFRSTIQLRDQPFFGWITDLSQPDQLYLGVPIPFLGESISVLPFLMGVTMIWQSKMTMTDPKQKYMMYFMPVFLIFIFYQLPSGLNLYYAVFNILSMVQTRMIKKNIPQGDKAAQEAGKAASSGSSRPARPAVPVGGNRAERRLARKGKKRNN